MSSFISKTLMAYDNLGPQKIFLQFWRFITYGARKILNLSLGPIPVKEFHLSIPNNDPGISRALYLYGDREQQFSYVLEQIIRPNMTILDIGANLGFYVLKEASLLQKKGKIFAVEPSPLNYQFLLENIRLNGLEQLVKAYNMGFGEKPGFENMFVSECTNLNSFVSNMTAIEMSKRKLTNETKSIQMTNLEEFIAQNGKIDLLRMDIEGYEVEVLKGARNVIANKTFQGIITFETHLPQYTANHNLRPELEHLFNNGYKVKYITSNVEPSKKIQALGYAPVSTMVTSPSCKQGVYQNIKTDDAIKLITEVGGIRDVVLALNL